ncbi:MAG TPA: type 4a pilus biogenesis protein PilO [Thermodesulfobacteriota bacterium]|nr:type 4a pilus biogenesis protein PilO [Thermodesulfobacteriota bacterium]
MAIIENISDALNRQRLYVRLGILIGIIVIMCGVFWYFFWSPKTEELKSARNELQRNEAKLREYEAIAKELPKFEQEFKRLNREFEEASRKLPKEKEIPTLIDSIYAAVSASGLESNTFAPKPEVKKTIYAEIPIEMKVYTSYYDLAKFFNRVSKLPRIVNIRDLNLSQDKKKSTGQKIVLNAAFTAVTFRLLPPQPVQPDTKTDTKRKKATKKTEPKE